MYIWETKIGSELPCLPKQDCYAMALMNSDAIVGHMLKIC